MLNKFFYPYLSLTENHKRDYSMKYYNLVYCIFPYLNEMQFKENMNIQNYILRANDFLDLVQIFIWL